LYGLLTRAAGDDETAHAAPARFDLPEDEVPPESLNTRLCGIAAVRREQSLAQLCGPSRRIRRIV